MSQDTQTNKNKQAPSIIQIHEDHDPIRRSSTSTFKAKRNRKPTKKRASFHNIYPGSATPPASISRQQLSLPNLAFDLTRASTLGAISRGVPLAQISEHEQSYDFVGLNTNLSTHELDKYKLQYYERDSIYQRLLCKCDCELCKNKTNSNINNKRPSLGASQSYDSAPLPDKIYKMPKLKQRNSAYNINGSIQGKSLLFRNKSLSISYSRKNLVLSNLNSQELNYKHSLACICEKDADLPLINIMGIGAKNDICNFLHILNDINSKMISINTPKNNKFNKFKKQLSMNHHNDVPILMLKRFRNIDSLHSAIRTYHKRLSQPLDFAPQYMIYDNVKEIIDIIKVMTHIVKCFVNGHGMPFQIDVMIIAPKTQKNNLTNIIYNDDEDDDDDDDEDDDDDIEVVTDDEEEDIDEKETFFTEIGDMFSCGLLQKHFDHFYEQCIVLDRSDNGIKSFKKYLRGGNINIFKKSMQNGRYVIVVDRGGKHTHKKVRESAINFEEKKDSDYMYFFQPPKPYGDIIGYNRLIEILHLNTLQCLLPKINQRLNVHNINDDEKSEKINLNVKEEFYGAKDLCNGEMLCISFHVLSEDEIRCYLYVDQKYLRIDLDENKLEEVLKCYIESISDSEISNMDMDNCKRSKDSKYNKFAFATTDIKFDKYFKWVQERVEQQHQRSSSHKKEQPLDIGNTTNFVGK